MQLSWILAVFLAALASFISNLGVNLQKLHHIRARGTSSSPSSSSSSSLSSSHPSTSPPPLPTAHYSASLLWRLGLLLIVFGSLFDVAALGLGAQSLVAPLGSLTLVSNILCAYLLLKERVTRYDIMCTGLIIGGSTFAVAFGKKEEEAFSIDDLFSFFTRPAFIVYATIVVVFSIVCYTRIHRLEMLELDEGKGSLAYLRQRSTHRFYYPALAGTIGAQSVLFAKCLTGDHMVLTRSGWTSLAVIHRELEEAKLQGAVSPGSAGGIVDANVRRVALPLIWVLSFNRTTSAMEWKRVTAAQRFPAGQQRLFRMQGKGMDVVATEDHRMLTGMMRYGKLLEGTFDYQTVGTLVGRTYSCNEDASLTTSEYNRSSAVVRCGKNLQPDFEFRITQTATVPGMEAVCKWWWRQDHQLAFLRFVGFWLGDGHLDVAHGLVGVSQRKLEPTAWLIDLLDEVFPRWWYRNVCAADDKGVTFIYTIRCPPLFEWLRVMAVGPPGYVALHAAAIRTYPHFQYEEGLAAMEADSSYRPRPGAGAWTEANMLTEMRDGPPVRRPCHFCRRSDGVRLTCSGVRCRPANAITRAHPDCVVKEDASPAAQVRLNAVKTFKQPWFCPDPQCQLDKAEWVLKHPSSAPSAAPPASTKKDTAPSQCRRCDEKDDDDIDMRAQVQAHLDAARAAAMADDDVQQVSMELPDGSIRMVTDYDVRPMEEDEEEKEWPAIDWDALEAQIPAGEVEALAHLKKARAAEAAGNPVYHYRVAGAYLLVWNGGLWCIINSDWFYLKRWLGPPSVVANTFSNLSQQQAVALLEGFCRADGTWADVQFDATGAPTGCWLCSNSSFPLIDHLQLIGQLAGARVDLERTVKKGKKSAGFKGPTVKNRVDHWQLQFNFNEMHGAKDVHVAVLAKPVDVSNDDSARGYHMYVDDGYVYDLTVEDNHNFLTQRLSRKLHRGAKGAGEAGEGVKAHPVFVGNCSMELLSNTWSPSSPTAQSMFWRWQTYVVLTCMFTSIFLQIKYLNEGLRRFSSTYSIPVFQAFWIIISVVSGLIFYKEYEGFEALDAALFTFGVIVTVVGVIMLSGRDTEDHHHAHREGHVKVGAQADGSEEDELELGGLSDDDSDDSDDRDTADDEVEMSVLFVDRPKTADPPVHEDGPQKREATAADAALKEILTPNGHANGHLPSGQSVPSSDEDKDKEDLTDRAPLNPSRQSSSSSSSIPGHHSPRGSTPKGKQN